MIKQKILIILFSFFYSIFLAQESKAIISYKGTLNQKFVDSILKDMETKDIPKSHKKFSIEAYNNARDIEFILNIKNNESFYYHNPDLEIENGYNTTKGIVSRMPYYTNNSLNKIIEINSHIGNISHSNLKWKITNITKKIGVYQCYKAISEEEIYSRRGFFYKEKVVAWFTPKIPLNFGPKYYKGLPGLILEIEKKKFSIIATEINLNPTKKINIKKPNLKKVFSQEEKNRRYKEMIEDGKKN